MLYVFQILMYAGFFFSGFELYPLVQFIIFNRWFVDFSFEGRIKNFWGTMYVSKCITMYVIGIFLPEVCGIMIIGW